MPSTHVLIRRTRGPGHAFIFGCKAQHRDNAAPGATWDGRRGPRAAVRPRLRQRSPAGDALLARAGPDGVRRRPGDLSSDAVGRQPMVRPAPDDSMVSGQLIADPARGSPGIYTLCVFTSRLPRLVTTFGRRSAVPSLLEKTLSDIEMWFPGVALIIQPAGPRNMLPDMRIWWPAPLPTITPALM